MTIRRSMLGALCAAVIAVIGPRAVPAAEPPTTARVSESDRARVLAQIDTVGRRGFLYEVTRDAPLGRDRATTSPAGADAHDDAIQGPAHPASVATGRDAGRGSTRVAGDATHDDAGQVPAHAASTATLDDPSPAGKRLFLYGTIHVGRVGSEPFNAPVMRALRVSNRLALEADPSDDASARELAIRLGQYPADDGLQRHVPAALLARVAAFGERNGLSHDRIERFRPWLLANMVTVRQFGDSGLDADLGSELYLAGFARSASMPIVEVEGLESQLRLLAASPDAVQNAELDEALSDDDDATDDTRALFDLWLTGDAVAGDRLIDAMHRDASAKVFERYLVDTLIDARNRRMADALEIDFAQPGTTFFAVGALHLFGERGLVRELARRGYRVTDLQPPLAIR